MGCWEKSGGAPVHTLQGLSMDKMRKNVHKMMKMNEFLSK